MAGKKKPKYTTTINEALAKNWCHTGQNLIAVARKLLPKRIKGFTDDTRIAPDDLEWLTRQKTWRAISDKDTRCHMNFWLPFCLGDFNDVIDKYSTLLRNTSPCDELYELPFTTHLDEARLKKAVAVMVKAQKAFSKELKALSA